MVIFSTRCFCRHQYANFCRASHGASGGYSMQRMLWRRRPTACWRGRRRG
ncbi:hypothetical protein EDWATA_00174 [Edwardsiella tarda ATCC 23685]|uniref:Uncharacterized protein n=1 Tax=Edwardsiella tarda ATCC 23685 TaxID=500638 RepID=D4F0F1_EDWTA|nr:hypothetical protein EDWATA_00174 [Edwardsiella tarda ATCC 23685]